MASKKRREDGGLELVMVGAIYFLVYIAPIILIVVWIIAELRVHTKLARNTALNKEVSEEEAASLSQERKALDLAERKIGVLLSEGDGAMVRRRQDGLFDERSGLGFSLNRKIEEAIGDRQNAERRAESINTLVAERQHLWASRFSQRFGTRCGVGAWCIAAAIVMLAKPGWSLPAAAAIASVTSITVVVLASMSREKVLLTRVQSDALGG